MIQGADHTAVAELAAAIGGFAVDRFKLAVGSDDVDLPVRKTVENRAHLAIQRFDALCVGKPLAVRRIADQHAVVPFCRQFLDRTHLPVKHDACFLCMFFAEVDTVLVSVRAPVGDINVAEERCCIGRGLASVKSKNIYNSYILYLMQSLKTVFDRFNGEGTVFGSINKKAFEEMQIIVPTGNVISKFDSIASSMDCQIKRTEQQSRRLAELRDTLLPKLMSGELNVFDKPNDQS